MTEKVLFVQTLYNHPINLFVAQFIGSPTMIVIDCGVTFGARDTVINIGSDSSFTLSKEFGSRIDGDKIRNKKVSLGIRPEAVSLKTIPEEGYIRGRVCMIEPVGHYDIIDVQIGDSVLKAKVSSRLVANPGQPVWARLDEKRIQLFDSHTGLSLMVK
jgi:multiple sugar transport system ATP-binding protein